MSEKDTGGAAFPREAYINPQGVTIRVGSDGMTLRDWFAGQALPDIMRGFSESEPPHGVKWNRWVAGIAYAQADAMLEARKGK